MTDSLWPHVQEAVGALGTHYQEQTQVYLTDGGYVHPDWTVSFLAYGIEPEPLTAVTLRELLPYIHVTTPDPRLIQAVEHGFLASDDGETYGLTANGRAGMERFFSLAWEIIGELTPLPDAELNRLANLLHRIVAATVATSQPIARPRLRISRRTDPGLDAPALVRIDQYLTDLLQYRDDAHTAVWTAYGITGQVWEAFTYFWRGDVQTVAELFEKLPRRGFSEAEYAEAAQELVQRGWLVENDGLYQITASGRQLRDEAETKTEENFHVGFWVCTQSEIAELTSLLIGLKEGLALPAEPVPA